MIKYSRPGTLRTGALALLDRFTRDRRAVSAVEFALILPFMVSLYLGTVEISQGVNINRKVTITARSIADLVARSSAINNADMAGIFDAARSVILPYPTTTLSIVITHVKIDVNGNATVDWSDGWQAAPRAKNSTVAVPANLKGTSEKYLILTEVKYRYEPVIGYVVTGPINLADEMYMAPRLSDSVTRIAS